MKRPTAATITCARSWVRWIVVAAGTLLPCCDSGRATLDGAPAPDGLFGVGATSPRQIRDDGARYLGSCRAFASRCQGSESPHCGACQYRVLHDARGCSRAKPCDDLLLALDADRRHACTFLDRPRDRHCSYFWSYLSTLCVEWFGRL